MIFGLSRKRRPTTTLTRQGQPQEKQVRTLEVEGRRFISDAEATYLLPKDLQDIPRLDFQHYLLRQAMKGIYIAPVLATSSAILDVGCGTGRWCIEMAQAFPQAQVIGTDLEEVNRAGGERPTNYLFKQGNALQPFPFAENSFDFVHMRLMLLSIPLTKWGEVLSEIMRVTKPAGWIEMVEVGCTIWPQGPATQQWYGWIREACKQYDQDADMPCRLRIMALQAGFTTAREHIYDIPIGKWAGHLGKASLANMRGFYEAMRARNVRQLGISSKLIDQTWRELAEEWELLRAHIRYYVVYAQK